MMEHGFDRDSVMAQRESTKGNIMRENYRVEITENDGRVRRGFLSREDDENPNSRAAVQEFASLPEAREAIDYQITWDPATELEYWVIDDNGHDVASVVFGSTRWVYDF